MGTTTSLTKLWTNSKTRAIYFSSSITYISGTNYKLGFNPIANPNAKDASLYTSTPKDRLEITKDFSLINFQEINEVPLSSFVAPATTTLLNIGALSLDQDNTNIKYHSSAFTRLRIPVTYNNPNPGTANDDISYLTIEATAGIGAIDSCSSTISGSNYVPCIVETATRVRLSGVPKMNVAGPGALVFNLFVWA